MYSTFKRSVFDMITSHIFVIERVDPAVCCKSIHESVDLDLD